MADTHAIEIGTKFRSDVSGFITGLRFYKTSGNTGTHIGRLWTAAGTQLAQATFSGESASGWQQVSFGSPVAINANTTYIAAYHAPNGHYAAISATSHWSAKTARRCTRWPPGSTGRTASTNMGRPAGSSPAAGPTPSTRRTTWSTSSLTTKSAPTRRSPVIIGRSPVVDATEVSPESRSGATFNEPMGPASINGTTVRLRDSSNALVAATVSYSRRIAEGDAGPE